MAISMTPPDTSSLREETTSQFLARRERELTAQIAALRGQLAPKEAELSHVQHMRSFLPTPDPIIREADAHLHIGGVAGVWDKNSSPSIPAILASIYGTKTIKELTIQALLDNFPNGGTVSAIRDFIRDAYSRTIEPGSMRSQMHRLKADKILHHDAEKDRWDFATGKRALYDTYSQVPPASMMPELQDDISEEDSALLEAARKLAWNEDDFAKSQGAPMTATERLHKLIKNVNGDKK